MIQRIRYRDGRKGDVDHGPGAVQAKGGAHDAHYVSQLRDIEDRDQRRPHTMTHKPGVAVKWR